MNSCAIFSHLSAMVPLLLAWNKKIYMSHGSHVVLYVLQYKCLNETYIFKIFYHKTFQGPTLNYSSIGATSDVHKTPWSYY
jgi:hypothetical protein